MLHILSVSIVIRCCHLSKIFTYDAIFTLQWQNVKIPIYLRLKSLWRHYDGIFLTKTLEILLFKSLYLLTQNLVYFGRRGVEFTLNMGRFWPSWFFPSKIVQLAKQASKYVNIILFCKFSPNFMMITSSIQKLWPFCQLVLLEFPMFLYI